MKLWKDIRLQAETEEEHTLNIWLPFTSCLGIARQPHYTPLFPVTWNALQLPSRFPEIPSLLLYCFATNAFGVTHSSAVLEEEIPIHNVASNEIVAPA